MTRRTEKVESVLQKEVGELISQLELPCLVTVSRVEVTNNLAHAKIWVTILDNSKQKGVIDELKKNLKEWQKILYDHMTMKFVPRISFLIDHSQEYVSRISELLREVHKEDDNV